MNMNGTEKEIIRLKEEVVISSTSSVLRTNCVL